MFIKILWIGCALQLAQAACEEQTADQPATTKCKPKKCDVLIGGTGAANQYCSQCATAAEFLVNGECKTAESGSGCVLKSPNDGTCKSCGAGYFLYKGGCYGTGDTTGQKLCTTAATEGVCTQGAEGYFAVPGATKTDESVVACNDATTGVTVSTNKKYVGVDGCSKCSAPQAIKEPNGGTAAATCSECTGTKIVKTDKGVTSCIAESACNGGFFVKESGGSKTCEACDDDNCATCAATGKNQCSKCKATNTAGAKLYLKTESSSPTGTCVDKTGCTDGNYIDEAAKTCSACASAGMTDCKTCGKKDGVVACASCEDSQKFGLNKKSCVKDCPANSQAGSDSVCVCNGGFTPSEESSACAATSRSVNLSSGAIAGISVAAVVVVGGLVGFLCWGFICRGKA